MDLNGETSSGRNNLVCNGYALLSDLEVEKKGAVGLTGWRPADEGAFEPATRRPAATASERTRISDPADPRTEFGAYRGLPYKGNIVVRKVDDNNFEENMEYAFGGGTTTFRGTNKATRVTRTNRVTRGRRRGSVTCDGARSVLGTGSPGFFQRTAKSSAMLSLAMQQSPAQWELWNTADGTPWGTRQSTMSRLEHLPWKAREFLSSPRPRVWFLWLHAAKCLNDSRVTYERSVQKARYG